ncbi:uncharacterized protein (DUF58 family) [Arthrobacter sp. CAN_A6]|uniref:DUF58 domain-containing protein n=1 Tax=Arthrobacter sp. CAN_A6 TaxID=2787721 RepID=UPI0018CBBDCE
MTLLDRLPSRVLTPRGWGFTIAAAVALLFAQTLGRRDLLYLGVLLLCLPLLSVLILRWSKPRFTVERRFSPQSMETGSTTTVGLALASSVPSGALVLMQEQLPARFGEAPKFAFPSHNPTSDGLSLYEYRLRSSARGMYRVGPVLAEFSDPFGLGKSRHQLGGTDTLVVTPAPIELLQSALSGSRGSDGMAATRRQANPSDDDVMTREYRHGDSMRRVHWAATARHSELMVRQEESVTAPEATLLLDQRTGSFSAGFSAAIRHDHSPDGSSLSTSPTFEWAVTAAVSISAHLLERNYALRFLDHHGAPALLRSPSAPFPGEEEHQGQGALANIAEGLAALEPAAETGHAGSSAVHGGEAARSAVRRLRANRSNTERVAAGAAFGDELLDKLAANRHRGPVVALLGLVTAAEATALGAASEYGSAAFAILVTDRPRDVESQLEILRSAGWQASAASPDADLREVWAGLGQTPATATGVRTGTSAFPGTAAEPGRRSS